MRLLFLGTSAAQPTEDRGLSCVCLERDGEILMFDAGEATQMAFMKSSLKWNKKTKLFVTHMHGDHCIGILGLLQTMSMQQRTETLEIFGPSGIEEFVAANMKVLNFELTFPIIITVIQEGKVFDNEKFSIYACKADHTVTAFSYLFEEKDRPGKFNKEKAQELGVPEGKMWGELQRGKDVTINEKTIKSSQVVGERRLGKKIGISGDTMPSAQLEKFFQDCDYLVFDSTFINEDKLKAQETHHSTAGQAATLAKNAKVKNLVLTHFSARYLDVTEHLRQAREIHDSVTAAKDQLVLEIKQDV